jgi:dienelactone hydrolase
MHTPICTLLLAAGLLGVPAAAQAPQVVRRTPGDSVANSYRVYAATGTPRALLVLLPGWGDDLNAFERSSPSTPSTLPARLASRGVVTITALPDPETLFEADAMVVRLDSMVAEVLQRYGIPRERVAVGGFSAGGTGAVRYAQHCARDRCRGASRVAAVFAVDPPLDWERVYRTSDLIVRRNAPRSNIEEERRLVNTIRRAMGGTPDQRRSAYLRHSPVIASSADGGNARHLASTAVRIYTEPDVHWWMQERNLDFHGMNSVDHAALINLLRVRGNTRAELITTTGKGFRPDGRRHPHSWSIVDEEELIRWLAPLLALEP